MKQKRNRICVAVVGVVFACVTLASWLIPERDFSDSERRKLTQLPTLSLETVLDGSFMSDFERYTQDQFPLRDQLRTLKAYTAYGAFHQLDNNGIYLSDGYAAKLEYPLDETSVQHATDRFAYLYDRYLADRDCNVYVSVVPDKSYYLAQQNGYLSMDYEKLISLVRENMDYATYVDITTTLELVDYYRTDTHWRHEKLLDTAQALADAMGVSISADYEEKTLEQPFYGVYYGQAALPMPAETMVYLTNACLDACVVTNFEDGTVGGVYDLEKAMGKDPYELFLSGSVSLLTVENPNAAQDKELILFRDSFGSSIAPLLAQGYSKITLVDIRYLRPEYLERFVTFDNQDVLFLYSTLVLNNSETIL